MAHVAFDIDGTAAAYPQEMQELMSSLKAAGHRVSVVTGTGNDTATQQDFDEKANLLNTLGMGESYDDMTVISHSADGGLANAKAKWLVDNGADVLIDNAVANCKAALAAGVPLALCPWGTKVKDKK